MGAGSGHGWWIRPSALAGDGFELSEALAGSLGRTLRSMETYPASLAKFSKDGEPYEVGEVWQQPDLARPLERIRDQGRDGFYLGETARLIAEEMERGGGMITEEDLARYQAQERTPIHGTYRGLRHHQHAAPQLRRHRYGGDAEHPGGFRPRRPWATTRRPMSTTLRRPCGGPSGTGPSYMADADFADPPLERLTSKGYAEALRAEIDPDQASVSAPSDIALPA